MNIEKLYILFLAQGQKIGTDSRKIEKGQLFFALKGENFDGNQYALNALAQGARYAIVNDMKLMDEKNIIYVENVLKTLQDLALYHRRRLAVPIIAITGSNGKTTSKELIKEVLSKRFKVAYTKGNLNNHIGIPLTLLDIKAYEDISIVEMGANHVGEIAAYCQYTEPNFGIITNIGKAHLEGFGGIQGVIKAKTELYSYIQNKNGKIFININDPILVEKAIDIYKIPYGQNTELPIYGSIIEQTNTGISIEIYEENTRYIIKTNLAGEYNLYNVLLAYTIGRYFEIESDKIIDAIENYQPSNSRSQIIKDNPHTIILDAYNANPSSMDLALKNLSTFHGRKMAILGAMKELGQYSNEEHQAIINLCSSLNLDKIVLVGKEFEPLDLPRDFIYYEKTEDAKNWYQSQGFYKSDIVLIKGSRSMKLEQILES